MKSQANEKRALSDNNTKEINDNSVESKASVDVTSIIDSLPADTINEQNNTNDEMCNEIVTETILRVVYGPKMK